MNYWYSLNTNSTRKQLLLFILSFHHITPAELKVLAYMNGYANVLAFNQYHLHGKRTRLALRALNHEGAI